MYQVFKALDDAGFAHTDLVTWVEQLTNSYYFPGKERQLSGLQLGEEACVQFAPNGQRYATYLAPLQGSIARGPNAYWLGIIGGYFPPCADGPFRGPRPTETHVAESSVGFCGAH